ncbi:MAG: helix-turn-helix domain-containing protein, partial [Candidatus Omnitrophota bacterium]
ITATKRLEINNTASIQGDIVAPVVVLAEGAVLNGLCRMGDVSDVVAEESTTAMTLNEVASYLEVDAGLIKAWAHARKIPAASRGEGWVFYKEEIDRWVAKERVNG